MALPDELTPEQMAEMKGQQQAAPEAPDEMTPEQMAQAKGEVFPVEQPAAPQMPDVLTMDEMARKKLDMNLSGQRSDVLAEDLEGEITIGSASNVIGAAKEFYSQEHGWLEKAFYTLNIPQQFMARQAVNVLENAGTLTTEDAREILSRDQVNGSDIVNFYWRDPTTWYGKTGRFATGLAADILLDPLSYVGIGALTKAGKAATVAGKAVNLGKVSKAERAYYKTLEAVEKVIKSDKGEIVNAADDLLSVAERNEMAIARARDSQMGFDQLQTQLLASPEAKNQMLEQIRVGMTEKSWAQEWREGSRGLTMGARIPFTDVAFEVDMPGHLSKLASLPVMGLDGVFNFGRSYLRQTGLGDTAYNLLSDLGTRTGKFIFDVQQNTRLGSYATLREDLGEFEKMSKAYLIDRQKSLGTEKFAQLLADITDEMEMGLKSTDEAADLAKTFGKEGESLDFLTVGNAADTERMARLAENPGAQDLIADMREMMRGGMEAYKSRGLPFEELNPFGPGWARDYLKHDISDEFLAKFKEVNQSSDVIGEAMKLTPELMGKVDESAMARKYRGTIREANAASLEKFGVKMFVDDPVELVSRRMSEMHKVIQDHDLLESALPYAVKDKNPGVGYVKYNPDNFRRLSIDESDQFGAKWNSFVPEEMKTGASLYFPEDVYDRMLFSINGFNKSKPMTKLLNAADFYTNVWRNNALFGASYMGLNAFSNALTYLSFNDVGAPQALAKATAIFTPMAKNITINHPELGKLSGDTIFRMALEDNLLNSSMTKQMKFSEFAEHVASNRQARQSLGQKAMDVADTAFLWRASRGVVQYIDEIPKLATYISRLESGFSRAGAAEMAERYFYNFNNMSRAQSVVSTVIPFSSFPMKTAEMAYETAKSGKLAGLAIPGKVQAALDGAFVQDHEARGALDQMLPPYRNAMHPIHGELMPGMREVMIDVPWSYSTFGTIFNAEDSTHPLVQVMQLAGALKTKTEEILGVATEQQGEDMAEAQNRTQQLFDQNLDMFIPSYMREALTLAQINGAIPGEHFKKRYLPTLPTRTQIERGMDPERGVLDKGTIFHKFTNAVEFGQAMDKEYGENWLYNLAFKGRVESDDSLAGLQETAGRGEFIRRRMRQFTGGLASMNKLDSNFFMNTFAIKRQIDIKSRQLKSDIIESGALVDTERIDQEDFLKKWADSRPLAKEILALSYKKDALAEYYEFFLEAEKAAPDLDLTSVLFGTKEYEFDFGDKPDKEVYERLFKGKTKKNITNEEADDVMENIRETEGE